MGKNVTGNLPLSVNRIVLQGQELLTSNMMVRFVALRDDGHGELTLMLRPAGIWYPRFILWLS